MLFSYFQKREILRVAVNVAADRVRERGNALDARMAAVSIVDAAIAAQERLIEKDGGMSDRLLLSLRKAKDGMIEV